MVIYRIKQFLWTVTSSFKPIDKSIIYNYLNDEEVKLFFLLRVSEQHHSIRVCKDALMRSYDINYIDKKKLARIALLHDIGKINSNLNVVDKSILVILDKITSGKLKRYKDIKKIDYYYNHPKKSVDLLKHVKKYDDEFLEAIEKHHYNKIESNIYLKIIKEADNNS